MSRDSEKFKLINIIIHILMIIIASPILLLVALCLAIPLLFCVVIVYLMYCHGLLATWPWLTWPFSIWLIALGLFGTGQMICDTFYRGN